MPDARPGTETEQDYCRMNLPTTKLPFIKLCQKVTNADNSLIHFISDDQYLEKTHTQNESLEGVREFYSVMNE